ncbi:AzlC family ABC transporter permease [Deinococcus maricopensis]|uniref:AzlC family protein n=1 Tax=Deinococcus maricopensis (strain DSM 21211 / LMG 22137 / NRRL B-23946 / LB-34) TaxID=709986 RepID=E8U3K0_DEIML|nr:AzlC family ABC transporter permease [Deinococcus maricopensis]ADV68624.1 AzlC family protein [Deinococcus maricopensis DSM 21211]
MSMGDLKSGAAFRAGFVAMLPLWLGVAPFAAAYAVTARAGGLSVLETMLMSLTVFAGSAQVSAAGLFGQGAGAVGVLGTTLLLNVRHVLYGLSLGRELPMTGWRRVVAAQFLTDEAYGIVLASGVRRFAFLLGAELSLYVVWNVCTLLGALAGAWVPDPERLGVGFVFPLAFLGLLLPLLRSRMTVLVAVVAGGAALALSRVLPGGLTTLLASVGAALLGALLVTRGRA